MRAACSPAASGQPGEDGDEASIARITQVEQLIEDFASRTLPLIYFA